MKQQVLRPFTAYGEWLASGTIVETGHWLNASLLTEQLFLGPAITESPAAGDSGAPAELPVPRRPRGKE